MLYNAVHFPVPSKSSQTCMMGLNLQHWGQKALTRSCADQISIKNLKNNQSVTVHFKMCNLLADTKITVNKWKDHDRLLRNRQIHGINSQS